jgi:hypothetical protein
MIIKVKLKNRKGVVTHNHVMHHSVDRDGNVTLKFKPGYADVVYLKNQYIKIDRVLED